MLCKINKKSDIFLNIPEIKFIDPVPQYLLMLRPYIAERFLACDEGA